MTAAQEQPRWVPAAAPPLFPRPDERRWRRGGGAATAGGRAALDGLRDGWRTGRRNGRPAEEAERRQDGP